MDFVSDELAQLVTDRRVLGILGPDPTVARILVGEHAGIFVDVLTNHTAEVLGLDIGYHASAGTANAVVVYSPKPQRRALQHIGGVAYRVRRVPEEAIFGTSPIWSGTAVIEMATVHRTLIDVLDAPEMGGGGRQMLEVVQAYWKRRDADGGTVLDLAARLGRGSIFKRLGFTAERFAQPADAWLEACRERLSAGVSLLDPSGPRRGPIVSRWRLRINVPMEDQP